ncbi:hypothetical protein GGX14DRAFT_406243 [Mycena pura]|uniref:Nephrocystin 3-like N-terminal domain-containing protein n=1 Tax=Mycena pura TaxID=153505 RepID=A0AAD6Y5N9_9AGAR|nr:hypothetical protein GGX14DRAFT_406243 [Mycena pura]
MSASSEVDLSSLFTELRNLANDIGSFDLRETESSSLAHLLKDCRLQPEELKLRRRKVDLALKYSKLFLDSCDAFLLSLSSMNMVAAPVYAAVRFIVTIAAAKSEILEEVLGGLNDVFDGLPLVTHSVKISNPSNPDHRVIVSVLKAFVMFVGDVKGYVGEKGEPIIQRVMRTFKSTTILHKVRTARKKMRNALDLAQFGVLINHIKTQSESHLRGKIGLIVGRLHCTNYEHHLAQYVAKTSSIENPCAWGDSHPSITRWLSYESGASQLYISGSPGSGKSVFAAHMIQKVAQMVPKDGPRGGLLLYYFCGADPTVDPYSNLPQKSSLKAIAMSFLRQILSKENRLRIADVTLVEDFMEYAVSTQTDKYRDLDLQKWVVKFLPSFDTVRIIIDAVDQCEDAHRGHGLLPWILRDIVAHVLLVGCEGSQADHFLANWPRVTLGTSGTTQVDLEVYSRHVVRSYIPADDPIDETLVQDIVKRSENMFLYVFFLENLISEDDIPLFLPEKRLELLRKTPLGIFKMYSYYLYIQLQGITTLPGMDRILVLLLQLLVFSPSAVTWEIFLEVLQSSSLPPELALTRETIEAIARRAGGVLFDIRESTYLDGNRVRRHHIVPVHRTLLEYFQSSGNLLQLGGNITDSSGSVAFSEVETLYRAVAERGPAFLLEICSISLQNRRFQSFLNRYQHAADVCRQCLDDSSPRGVPLDSTANRHEVDRARLRGQLCEDLAFSSCDAVDFEKQWLDRQWNAVRQDLEWSRRYAQDIGAYVSENDIAIPQSLRDEISRLSYVLPRLARHLEICQGSLSELQTWHLPAYAFRNVVFYLHLMDDGTVRRQYSGLSSFQGLLQSYLEQLDMLLSAMAWDILQSLSVDSTSPTAKLAAMICALEPVSVTVRKLISPQKSRLYQILQTIKCLWLTRRVKRGVEGLWNPLHADHITAGFSTSIPDRLTRVTLQKALQLFAEAERLCFADATLFTGIGNLSFCIRQLRQLISHHLLFHTFDSTKTQTSGKNEFRLHEFSKQGFTKLVLLRDVSSDAVDVVSAPAPALATRSVLLALAFSTMGFLSSLHACFVFCLLSAPADIPYGALRLGQTWTWLPFASAAGVVGCSSAKLRPVPGAANAYTGTGTIAACVVSALLLLGTQRRSPSKLVMRILAVISTTECLTAMTLGCVLLSLALGQGMWPAFESAALVYGIVHLAVFLVDPSGMQRRKTELARIGRKYKWDREHPEDGIKSDLLRDKMLVES